jgi:hypothetical protein
MGDASPPPDASIAELLRHLDELIADAEHLRGDIARAADDRAHPVWPERRDGTRRFRERRTEERRRGDAKAPDDH